MSDTISRAIQEFIRDVDRHLAHAMLRDLWRPSGIRGRLDPETGRPVATERFATEADGERLMALDNAVHEHARKIRDTAQPLAEALERLGHDARDVLAIGNTAHMGGGGPAAVAAIWPEAKVRLQTAAIRLKGPAISMASTETNEQPPALTTSELSTLLALANFDPAQLATVEKIAERMLDLDRARNYSTRTIGDAVRRLTDMGLAERPEGIRQGARLTMKGRRLVPKIAGSLPS